MSLMNFADQLAGAIHDIKNRMQLMLPHAEQVAGSQDLATRQAGEQLQLGLEALNQKLVSLLGLYKLEFRQGIQCREVYVSDMLRSCIDYIPGQFNVSLSCDEDLLCFFDENLVKSVVSDALHNATRYAKAQIVVSAVKREKGVELRVEDDGTGFGHDPLFIRKDGKEGTGLGLDFARMVAAAHGNKEMKGNINLGKSKTLGGAEFLLYLP